MSPYWVVYLEGGQALLLNYDGEILLGPLEGSSYIPTIGFRYIKETNYPLQSYRLYDMDQGGIEIRAGAGNICFINDYICCVQDENEKWYIEDLQGNLLTDGYDDMQMESFGDGTGDYIYCYNKATSVGFLFPEKTYKHFAIFDDHGAMLFEMDADAHVSGSLTALTKDRFRYSVFETPGDSTIYNGDGDVIIQEGQYTSIYPLDPYYNYYHRKFTFDTHPYLYGARSITD